jgi:hypothetical protein
MHFQNKKGFLSNGAERFPNKILFQTSLRRARVCSSITREKVVAPVIKIVYMISFQALAPNNKIITYSRDYSTAAIQFIPEDFPIPRIPQLPQFCQ